MGTIWPYPPVRLGVLSAPCMAWHGMVEVCEGAPVAVSGWVLTDRHDVGPCAVFSVVSSTAENSS